MFVLGKRKFSRLVGLVAGLAALVMVASGCGPAESTTGQQQKKITIGYIAWDENIALSNLYKNALEEQGYTVDLKQLDAGPIYAGLAQGDIDVFMDAWLPATHEDYWNQHKNQLEDLGVWYDNATLNIAVPTYLKDVNSLEDLKSKSAMFKGTITGIEPSAGETRIVKKTMMPAYGLSNYQLKTSSTPAMLAALDKAINEQSPIVVTLWHPHWAYSRYDLKDLKDPKGSMGKGEQLHILGRKGFTKDFPNLAKSLKDLKMTNDELGSLEDMINKAGKNGEAKAAKEWAEQNKKFADTHLSDL
jgi:glycine betaine/proline transport system substrate-binding protein